MLEKLKEKYYVLRDKAIGERESLSEISKDKKIVISIIAVGLLTLCSVVVVMKGGETKEEVLSNFKTAVTNNDLSLLSNCLRVEDEKVNKNDLGPLLDYYIEKNEGIVDIVKNLRKNNQSDMLEVKSKKNIFSESYYINIERVDVKINSNIEGTNIEIGGENIKSGNLLKGIIPGIYVVNYELNTDFGDVLGEKKVVIVNDEEVDIEVDAGYITLHSDYEDAVVCVGNKNIGKKVRDIVNFGPIPFNKDIKLYIEKEFPWGTIKSDDVEINNGGMVNVNINMVNKNLISDIDSVLSSFFKSVFEALNNRDKSLIKYADENTKNKIYDDIFKKAIIFSNGYEIADLNLKIENSEFKYEDNIYKGSIVVKINYDIFKKILPFVKEGYEELFLVSMRFDDSDWIATDIQRFNVLREE